MLCLRGFTVLVPDAFKLEAVKDDLIVLVRLMLLQNLAACI